MPGMWVCEVGLVHTAVRQLTRLVDTPAWVPPAHNALLRLALNYVLLERISAAADIISDKCAP